MFGITTTLQMVVVGAVALTSAITGHLLTSAYHGVFVHPAIAREARSGYVLQTTLDAVQATVDETVRQLQAARDTNTALTNRLKSTAIQAAIIQAELENKITRFEENEKIAPGSNVLSDRDIDFLR